MSEMTAEERAKRSIQYLKNADAWGASNYEPEFEAEFARVFKDALEEAAKVCDERQEGHRETMTKLQKGGLGTLAIRTGNRLAEAGNCSAAIRALKES